MNRLNYHHLHYFWSVAREGNLTRAAEHLHVSQSALSTQIRALEDSLGQPLFQREGRRLVLTEAGQLAFSYAESIFRQGQELTALLRDGRRRDHRLLRIGAVSTLSRNFQEMFLAPVMDRDDLSLVLQAGRLDDLLAGLQTHALDVVLSNTTVRGDVRHPLRCRRIARQSVSVVGPPGQGEGFRLPEGLDGVTVLLPGIHSDIRAGFDLLCEQWGVHPHVRAEVDDMAMLRLLARDTGCLAVLPKVVVRDELASGVLEECAVMPALAENFYAITVKRHSRDELVESLIAREREPLLQ